MVPHLDQGKNKSLDRRDEHAMQLLLNAADYEWWILQGAPTNFLTCSYIRCLFAAGVTQIECSKDCLKNRRDS